MAPRLTRSAAAKEATSQASVPRSSVPQQVTVALPSRLKEKPGAGGTLSAKKAPIKKDNFDIEVQTSPPLAPPITAGKRKRVTAPKVEGDPNELPHNLGKMYIADAADVEGRAIEAVESLPKKRKIKKASEGNRKATDIGTASKSASTKTTAKRPRTKSAKTKDNPYGLTPGVTPYPKWRWPTKSDCMEIEHLLSKHHGHQGRPPNMPPPSLTITGCGEVPSILDALIRTLLSGNTTGLNSAAAMKGLLAKFGTLQEGVGKGSLNYNAIREAPLEEVVDAIKEGGMQNKKGMYIKMLLEIVHKENKARRDALVAAKDGTNSAAPKGAENESSEQKDKEITRAEEHVLSLDYIHGLEKDDAIAEMTKFPQIGVKTAACVVLFCMRKPCFAVDTHVFRLCKWLGWVPPDVGADPITTFKHLEVRIPDFLKYSLHQLFIKHGKTCPRCRAITGPNSEGWDEGCVIEDYVDRTGPTKEGVAKIRSTIKMKAKTRGEEGRRDDAEAKERNRLADLEEVSSDDDAYNDEDDDEEADKRYAAKLKKMTPEELAEHNAAMEECVEFLNHPAYDVPARY